MSTLQILSDSFAKAMIPKDEKKKKTTHYGTIVVRNGMKYVKLDGSPDDVFTPVIEGMEGINGDRVSVEIIDRKCVISGNFTAPPSSRVATDSVGLKDSVLNLNMGAGSFRSDNGAFIIESSEDSIAIQNGVSDPTVLKISSEGVSIVTQKKEGLKVNNETYVTTDDVIIFGKVIIDEIETVENELLIQVLNIPDGYILTGIKSMDFVGVNVEGYSVNPLSKEVGIRLPTQEGLEVSETTMIGSIEWFAVRNDSVKSVKEQIIKREEK